MNITYFTANGPQTKQVLIKDISETGFSFLSDEEFNLKRTVRLNLPFSEHYKLELTAQIIREEKPKDTEESQGLSNKPSDKPRKRITETLYGCKFVEQNPKLPTYLMKKQQEKRGQRV